ncbi:MAG: glycerol-3-phosphate 1-O-acyltransferase PlsY [Pedosphaera parvula]|nr:glycerol-3-phosphate 1-O-acyltransferase PlsY [Pedosphaera parvula]
MIAYLLGSIPTGYLVARAKGVDIRTLGSGNIGATNVFRFLGKTAGIFVLLADAFKGYAACRWAGDPALLLLGGVAQTDGGRNESWVILAGVGAVLGHNYTCWLKFKGGKGIATSAGVLVALVPWALLACLGVWGAVFIVGRYVSLASIVAAFVLPFAVWLMNGTPTMIALTSVLAALAIYRHKGNIQRLLNGTESRIGGKKPQNESTS